MTQDTDTRHLPAVTADGECTMCGADSFTLAQDHTVYTPSITFVDGKPVSEGCSHIQQSDAEDSARFFCASCGERHQVPGELLE